MDRHDTWRCLYPDSDAEMAERLPVLQAAASHRWGAFRMPENAVAPGRLKPDAIAYTSEDTGEIRHLLAMMTGRTFGQPRIGAAYPFAPHGTPYAAQIRALHPDENGIEGEVSATVNGTELRYYEPLFGIKRRHYREGTEQRVRFSAFGYALSARGTAPLPDAAAAGAKAAEPEPILSALISTGPGPSSRYGFHGPIAEWRGFWNGEHLFYALKIPLVMAETGNFTVDVYAGRPAFKTQFTPGPGIALSGVVWLHGTLVE